MHFFFLMNLFWSLMLSWFLLSHFFQCIQLTAKDAGQISLLVKRNSNHSVASCNNNKLEINNDSRLACKGCEVHDSEDNLTGNKSAAGVSRTDPRDDPPPGTDYPRIRSVQTIGTGLRKKGVNGQDQDLGSGSAPELRLRGAGCVMSCSDKIAKWNALGIVFKSTVTFCIQLFQISISCTTEKYGSIILYISS